ncbi:lipocalin family protein [Bacteroides sp.]|uniref:lipocalin family protein n=1 Tax=Bacteroides sp. TaxID=29523 RepID=UPI00258E6F84|nr:lipocalin family protein [Bacteroides sp.]
MIRFIFKTALCVMLAVGFVSCNNESEEPVVYENVNYSTISGTWMLTEFNGKALEEGQYVYITFNRKEHTFEMYDNMGSMYSHKSTGTFEITEDDEIGYILTGEYDFSHDAWKEYVVSEMTAETMKWTVKDDAEDVSVYTRCAEIPEDVLNGSRSL